MMSKFYFGLFLATLAVMFGTGAVVVLGNTGVGKSSLLNMLAGRNVFRVGEGVMSETSLTAAHVGPLLGKSGTAAIQLRLIDTQGLSDSGGNTKDMENIKSIVEFIKNEQAIDLFILCFDGTSPRFSSYAQSAVNVFRQIFPDFLKHTVLVFNKWKSPDLERMRKLRTDYQVIFKREYGVTAIPCFFLDSFFNVAMLRDNVDGTQSVRHLHANIRARTQTEIDALVAHLVNKQSECDVRSIEAKNTERQRLINEREALELKCKQEKEAHQRLVEQRIEHERQLYEHRISLCIERCASFDPFNHHFHLFCAEQCNQTGGSFILNSSVGK